MLRHVLGFLHMNSLVTAVKKGRRCRTAGDKVGVKSLKKKQIDESGGNEYQKSRSCLNEAKRGADISCLSRPRRLLGARFVCA